MITLRYAAFLATLLAATSHTHADEPVAEIQFNRDIRPLLSDNCFVCHGPDAGQRQADLRLDTREGAAAVLVAGSSDNSELIARISSDDPDLVMPPADSNRTLSPDQIDLLRCWVDQGAPWGTHWSFTPPARPEIPRVEPTAGAPARNPIDAFVQARLSRAQLGPSPQADRETLIRRVTLDLTGLPPTPAEVDAFLQDDEPQAYERLVDRLLMSAAYGERMAWNWLDAARYADSNGYQGDRERTMWPWRDWVVKAFNENLPYDQFTTWQLAGDLLERPSDEQRLATGFCRNHMINGEGGRIAEENRVDYVMDMTETMGTVWLGLTLNCCRCHDHKFDPLAQRDYYELFAFFNQTPVTGGGGDPQTPPIMAVATAEQRRRIRDLQKRLVTLTDQSDGRSDGEHPDDKHADEVSKELREKLQTLRNQFAKVMVMEDMAERRSTHMLDRGLYNKPGEEVSAAMPDSLPAPDFEAPPDRRDLARWLVSAENPLTARVTVNRFWQQCFGIGLVKTTEDFGSQGEIPRQQELLDWLACEFRDGGWDVKGLLRRIVTSHTYRQTAAASPELFERDPDNRLLARGPRFRMPSWMLRDQALAASGLLVDKLGGAPVNGYQPAGVWEEATFGNKKYSQDHGEALYRRSLYTFWRRIIAPTMFFDTASRQTCTVKPLRTNTPLHALTTLNDTTFVEAARALAARTLRDNSLDDDAQRLDLAYRRLLARHPSDAERQILLAGLERSRRQFREDPQAATQLLAVGETPRDERLEPVEHASWTALCLALLNLDSTLTKE